MCGIVGIVNCEGRPVSTEILREMTSVLCHRGPDESGVFTSGPVGLGHTRLSVIDLSGGQQPMSNDDQSLWITFNGEIYNYVELRDTLKAKGHRFRSLSDTEVILHMYEEQGPECVRQFNGQWAFAIWDARRRRLFLSRDRLGVRPLVYTWAGTSFLFGSEVKALFAHPGVRRQLDTIALAQIFTFWFTLPPRTAFRDVMELPPGHSVLVENGELRLLRHWSMDFDPGAYTQLDEAGCAERLWELLVQSTRLRLRADVPVGTYLSGGLDSSTVTAIINQFTNSRLNTFSISFGDPEFDETAYQNEVIRSLNTQHAHVRCSCADIARHFANVVWHMEKPVVRTAPAPLYMLSRLVREHGYKVVLTGEGADEILGGYDIFKEAKIRAFCARFPQSHLRPLLLRRLYPYMPNLQQQPENYLRAFFHIDAEDQASPFFSHLPRWQLTSKLKAFFSDSVLADTVGYDPYDDLASQLPSGFARWHPFCQAQFLETQYLLPGYILSSQGDRVAMAHSVEIRLPFLDPVVVAFAATIPPHMKMKVLNEKYILKRAAMNSLPAAICKRTKQPYRAPDGRAFFVPEAPDSLAHLLSPRQLSWDGVFNSLRVGKLVEKFRSGRAMGVKDDMALVGVLSTQLVIDQFLTNFSRRSSHRATDRTRAATVYCG